MEPEDLEKKKAEVIQLIRRGDPRMPKKKQKDKPPSCIGRLSISGDDNIVAGRDVNINQKKINKPIIHRGPEYISAAQARKIRNLVESAVAAETASGATARPAAFEMWWKKVQRHYDVNSYLEIPHHLGDECIIWLRQRVAMLRPKLRRANNESWRKELYKAIWSRARELGMAKGEVYSLAWEKLGIRVVSLTSMGEQNLKKLYQIIMRLA